MVIPLGTDRTVTEEEFRILITQPEAETIDYKSAAYLFPSGRHKFVKDVLAMSNTPRATSASIVLGVAWSPESGSVVLGLDSQFDDADFQDQFPVTIQPRPRFTYFPLQYDGKHVGVLDIPVDNAGPFSAIDDLELVKNTFKIQKGVIYYRRGTQNAQAVGPELSRIHSWFLTGRTDRIDPWDTDSWRQLLDGVRRFERGRIYVMAAAPLRFPAEVPLHSLGLQSWRAVIDFDNESDDRGLLSRLEKILTSHRVIHRAVGSNDVVQPEPATHWFFARGLAGRRDSLHVGDHIAWLRSHKRILSRQLDRIAAASSPTPVVTLVVWPYADMVPYLRALLGELHSAFMDALEVVVVGETTTLRTIVEEEGAIYVQMPIRELCHGLAVFCSSQLSVDRSIPVLPSSSGAPIEVPRDDWLWMSENLVLLQLGSGLSGDDDAAGYRIGGDITWRNLLLRHDCDRTITPAITRRVDQDLQSRITTRVNVYHAPGAGGTTVGRRVAWDLHQTYPVVILHSLTSDGAADKIGRVFALTGQSVLVLVDGGSHAEREVGDLYERLRANNTPAVLLQVLRRFDRQNVGRRQYWLEERLLDEEADRFRDAYSRAVPRKRTALHELARSGNQVRSAFFFGLTAFEEDYRGLNEYVATRTSELTDPQRQILVYIAVAYYYGQQPVPVQAFAALLGLPPSKTLRLIDAFAGPSARALGLLVETESGEWRTSHQLIALQILKSQLAPEAGAANGDIWRQRVSEWAKAFADFCRAEGQPESDRLLELARRVFIYRDNVEVLGTERASHSRYAQLIEDIPSPQGRIEVLEHLTQRFPTEAHFHSHLARLLSQNGEHKRALDRADYAISLQPNDHVLHHMRGMVLRQEMRISVERRAELPRLIGLGKGASESFDRARKLRPDEEHSYVSEVQMLIMLVDYAGRGRGDVVRDVLVRQDTDPYVKTALERADGLLDQVRHLYSGERPSRYVQDCRARLARFYGDYEYALQAWDNLLSRSDVPHPPIRRQIVWTLLRRRAEAWTSLRKNEVSRVRQLLEDNLQEDPNDSTSLRLWLRAVRLPPNAASLDHVIERVTYWKANTNSWDAAYYLYVLQSLRALDGSIQGAADAGRALEECRGLTRFRRDRTRSFEWLGKEDGMQRLVHQSRLGDWKDDFWSDTNALVRIKGRIKSIDGPQKGTVEIGGAIDAFFVPARSGFFKGRDENLSVDCYLGFSYDGPRAWDVQVKTDD